MKAEARREAIENEIDPDAVSIPDWRLHDIRRTVASGLARLGVNLPVIEKTLNNKSGSFAGIVSVYQRHEYAEEKRQALEAWAEYLSQIVCCGEKSDG